MNDPAKPRVFLVGAGPGSPGLLTVRGAEVLARADLVLYDQLVPERLLDLAPATAERLCVRDLPGQHPDKYPHIHLKLIETANAGKTVVRLKGGDPLIFGRGGEEAEALRAAGLAYEIVPGVTAAIAAGAYLELPLTHRLHASAVAFVTGHELPNKPGNKLDWKALAAFPGTLAIYMGIARLPVIVGELLKYGKSPDTPVGIVERASLGEQRSVFATLATIEDARRHAGLEAPGLILIGDTVAQRAPHPWFESRPLFGQRVLVTRPAHQAAGMVRKLEHLGAVVSRMPVVEIRELADFAAVDRALDQLRAGAWDWLVFTSANGVHALLRRLDAVGRDLRDLGSVKLAAIGPKTAAALREYRLRADLVPASTFSSEGMVEALEAACRGEARAPGAGQPRARAAPRRARDRRDRRTGHGLRPGGHCRPGRGGAGRAAPRRNQVRHAAEFQHRPRRAGRVRRDDPRAGRSRGDSAGGDQPGDGQRGPRVGAAGRGRGHNLYRGRADSGGG